MRLKEFCELTGATPRQIHYWTRAGIQLTKQPIGDNDRNRDYDISVAHKVKLLAMVSEKMGQWFSVDTLAIIFEEYDDGFIDFGDGITLDWKISAPFVDTSTGSR